MSRSGSYKRLKARSHWLRQWQRKEWIALKPMGCLCLCRRSPCEHFHKVQCNPFFCCHCRCRCRSQCEQALIFRNYHNLNFTGKVYLRWPSITRILQGVSVNKYLMPILFFRNQNGRITCEKLKLTILPLKRHEQWQRIGPMGWTQISCVRTKGHSSFFMIRISVRSGSGFLLPTIVSVDYTI